MNNRFPGSCARCGEHVPAQAGECRLEAQGWRVYCATPCEPRSAQERKVAEEARRQTVGDLKGIMALFARARSHLKFPAIVLNVPELPGFVIRLNVAGPKAREPGSLTVVEAERDETGSREWLGRVSLDGTWQPGRDPRASVIGKRLQQFAAEPAKIAAEYGKLTGRCSFCNRPLSDERSTAVGYGSTCADHYGLPWGAKPAEFAGPARAA